MRPLAWICLCVAVFAARFASAGPDYFGADAPEERVAYQVDKSRTPTERWIIGSLFAAGAVFACGGVYFHLDSKDKADRVSATDDLTGLIYTPALDEVRRRGARSARYATYSYATGAAFVLGGLVAAYLTTPGTEMIVVEGASARTNTSNAPTVLISVDGALVSKEWTF